MAPARSGGGGGNIKQGKEQTVRENGVSSGSLKEKALASSIDKEPDFLLGLLEKVDFSVPAPKPATANGADAVQDAEAHGSSNPVLEAFSRYREAAGLALQRQEENFAEAFEIPRCGPMSSEWQSAIPGQESHLQSSILAPTEDGSHIMLDDHSENVGCSWQPATMLEELLPSWLSWLVPGSGDGADVSTDSKLHSADRRGEAVHAAHMHAPQGFAESTFDLPSRFVKGGGLRQQAQATAAAPPAAAFGSGSSSASKKSPGQLDLPVHPRMRPQPLSAIQEDVEPYKFNSAIFDQVDMHGLEALGLELAGDLCPAVRGSSSQGRPCRGHIRCGRLGKRVRHGALLEEYVLVTELSLPMELEIAQLKRLSSALRERTVHREDVCTPLGATLARLKKKGDSVWVAWSDPVGAACKYQEAVCLAEALLSHPPPDSEWRLMTAERICEAVAGIHAAGMSHGSLSPRNIWISRTTGNISLSDCGLVEALGVSGVLGKEDWLSLLGVDFGRYFAPEVWQTRRPAGPAGDVYAVGLVLMELLGEVAPPFQECTSMTQLAAKASFGRSASAAPSRGSTLNQLPLAQRCLEQCLHPSAGARPTAQDVFNSLAVPGACASAGKYGPSTGSMQDHLARTNDSAQFDMQSTVSTEDLSDTRSSGASFLPAPRGLPAESTYDLPEVVARGGAAGMGKHGGANEDWMFVPRHR
mmetsp:Transcript_44581/g.105682  ORF Transcript_44581/g.105682 Transcript_44581/m.105682 type:complete len:699 (+) Transcript_44581:89-2185(+)